MTTTAQIKPPRELGVLARQLDDYGQTLKLVIERPSGESIKLDSYLRGLVKTQSLKAWNGEPEKFRDWIAEQVAQHIRHCEVKIWNYGKLE